ncbi:MAG TPA: hypothetical protein VFO35_07845 [Steroidobacteraceae bacterium]|nr:hypothetical protein [Steroidobacteraceae bacterium]
MADDDFQTLREALRRMPTPEPRPGFVERAFARVAQQQAPQVVAPPGRLRSFATRWETWAGAALGGAVAAALMLVLLRPIDTSNSPQPLALALTLHEARNVDVLIDSDRELKGATIRVAASGSIVLDGFDDERQIDWQADLERGSNLLSLPVVARAAGKGRLVAVIEHEGRTRQVAIDLSVVDRQG